jgi:hypothetical protein
MENKLLLLLLLLLLYASGAEHKCQELIHALNAHMKFEKVPSKQAEHNIQELMLTLSVCVRN